MSPLSPADAPKVPFVGAAIWTDDEDNPSTDNQPAGKREAIYPLSETKSYYCTVQGIYIRQIATKWLVRVTREETFGMNTRTEVLRALWSCRRLKCAMLTVLVLWMRNQDSHSLIIVLSVLFCGIFTTGSRKACSCNW